MANEEFEQMQYNAFVAERVHLYVSGMMSDYPALAHNVKYTQHFEANARNLIMQITTWCASGRVPSNEVPRTVEWPDGPWQAFKQKYFPHWLLEKFPVRFHRETFTVTTNYYFVCPHLVTDPQSDHVRFMATGTRMATKFVKDGHTW